MQGTVYAFARVLRQTGDVLRPVGIGVALGG